MFAGLFRTDCLPVQSGTFFKKSSGSRNPACFAKELGFVLKQVRA